MDGIIAYILCKKLIASVTAGISNIQVNGQDLIITTNDGKILTMTFPTPKDGISVISMFINSNNHLICILSDGTTIDAGEVPAGKNGVDGKDGKDGISVQKIEIDKDGNLIFTLTDGTKQNVGFISSGMVRVQSADDLPAAGNENLLYLVLDDKSIYYFDGTEYQKIFSGGSIIGENGYVTKNDIDDLFKDESGITPPSSNTGWAVKPDIDKLFEKEEEIPPSQPSQNHWANESDIDKMFKKEDITEEVGKYGNRR